MIKNQAEQAAFNGRYLTQRTQRKCTSTVRDEVPPTEAGYRQQQLTGQITAIQKY